MLVVHDDDREFRTSRELALWKLLGGDEAKPRGILLAHTLSPTKRHDGRHWTHFFFFDQDHVGNRYTARADLEYDVDGVDRAGETLDEIKMRATRLRETLRESTLHGAPPEAPGIGFDEAPPATPADVFDPATEPGPHHYQVETDADFKEVDLDSDLDELPVRKRSRRQPSKFVEEEAGEDE